MMTKRFCIVIIIVTCHGRLKDKAYVWVLIFFIIHNHGHKVIGFIR